MSPILFNLVYSKILRSSAAMAFFLTLFSFATGQELYKYITIADHIDKNLWINENERSFDSQGIIMQNKVYHALSIAGFGIMNYEDFIVSGDSVSYQHVIDQYKYFCDSTKVVFTDNYKGMGLPYKFAFYDLKPPWFSGMTQGVAISFLLRYYKLTGDKNALDKVKQLAWFMLQPVEKGGTIGKTPEGYTFIEEYPGSQKNPQVMNGFINGLIGLREYLNFFPEDTLAQRIHGESYEAMIKTFREYDTSNNWTNYNRLKKPVSNLYMRYQITELEFLNSIYSDNRLLKQLMIWSYFAYNKPDKETKYYKNPTFQYSIPFLKVQNRISSDTIDFEKLLVSETNYSITKKSGKTATQLRPKNTYLLSFKDPAYHFNIYFDKGIVNAGWDLKYSNNELIKNQIGFQTELNRLAVNSTVKIDQFEIQFLNKKIKNLKIKDVKYYNSYQFEVPRFGFYNLTKVQQLKADSLYSIEVKGDFLNETVVFYRCGENYQKLKSAKYEIGNSFNLNQQFFKPEKSGVYQFFLSSPIIKGYWITEPTFTIAGEKDITDNTVRDFK